MKKLSELAERIQFEELFLQLTNYINNNPNIKGNNLTNFNVLSILLSKFSNRNFYEEDKIFETIYNLINDDKEFFSFLKRFYWKLDFDFISKNTIIKYKLNEFYIKNRNWVCEDVNRFIHSLKYTKYDSSFLDLFIQMYPYLNKKDKKKLTEKEEITYNNFWIGLTKYQNLTASFINKYYAVILTDKIFARNLKCGKNELYKCNINIVQKILVCERNK